MWQKKIINLLDDDELSSQVLKYYLESLGYRCRWFSKPDQMFESVDTGNPVDLFLLDYDLGKNSASGAEVCRRIKARHRKPVVMLTGDRSTPTVVGCIAVGADLYIEKPYDLDQLLARLGAILRLYEQLSLTTQNGNDGANCIRGLKINPPRRELTSEKGEVAVLTEKEFAFFEIICGRNEHFVSREESHMAIYGRAMDPMSRAIDNLACRLRTKFKKLGVDVELQVIRGIGYRLIKNEHK